MRTAFFKKLTVVLMLPLICAVLFAHDIDAQETGVTTSPVRLEWNFEKQAFDVLFSVHNRSKNTVALTSILVLKADQRRRWRGAHLPPIPPKTSIDFNLELSSALMLKNDYKNIYLNLYKNDYQTFLDKSAYYQTLSSNKQIAGGKVSVQLTELDFENDQEEVRKFILGSSADLNSLRPAGKAPGVVLSRLQSKPVDQVPFRRKRIQRTAPAQGSSRKSTLAPENDSPPKKKAPYQNLANIQIQGVDDLIALLTSEDFLVGQSNVRVRTEGYQQKDESARLRRLASNLESRKSVSLEVPLEVVQAFSAFEPANDLLVDISLEKNEFARNLKKAIEVNPDDVTSQEKLVNFYLDQGQTEKAIMFLSERLIQNPGSLNTSLKISRVLQKSGNRNEALEVLNTSLKRISLSARIALNQDLKSGVQAGKSTLPDGTDAAFLAKEFIKLGLSFLNSQQYDKALSAFQSLQSLSPEFPSLFYYLGMSRKGLQQYDEAKEAFLTQHKRKADYLENLDAATETFPFTMDIPAMSTIRKTYESLAVKEKEADKKTHLLSQAEKITALILETSLKIQKNSTDLALLIRTDGTFVPLQPFQDLQVKLTAMNLSASDSPSFKVQYKLVSRGGADIDLNVIDRQPGIKAGGDDRTWQTTLKMPGKLVYGDYRLTATLQLQEDQWDKNFKNNLAVTDFNYLFNGPDAKIAGLSYSLNGRFQEGTTVDMNIAWNNSGSLAVPESQLVIRLKDMENDEDSFTLQEIQVSSIPPISDVYTRLVSVTIPDISSWTKYQFEVSLKTESSQKDINPRNNTYLDKVSFENEDELVRSRPVQFYFHKDLSYPKDQIHWTVTVRHPDELKADDVEVDLRILNAKREQVYPDPEKATGDNWENVASQIDTSVEGLYSFTGVSIFPELQAGSYIGQMAFRMKGEDDTKVLLESNDRITYRPARIKLENLVVKTTEMLPGHPLEFQVVVKNEGGAPSKVEQVHVELAGVENYDLGEVNIDPLPADSNNIVLTRKLRVPANIRKGYYALNMSKGNSDQGESQRTRYPGLMKVSTVRVLLPQTAESFPQNILPSFAWEGDKQFNYRINLSANKQFDDEFMFSIPGDGWLDKEQVKPDEGEWRMIRMLAQVNQQPVYWRVEAINAAGKRIYSEPRLLKIR